MFSRQAMRRATFFLFLLVGIWTPAYAERYAVLAGVGEYESGIRSLEGPSEDIRALHEALLKQGYTDRNITVLLNSSATKHSILAALDGMVARLKPGDHLFFYFSGHGTSAFDENSREISPVIGPDSGGLLPADLDLNSLNSIADTLLIGRRDLRPILSRVPPQAQAFVVLDSCYSENSAKAIGPWTLATPRTVRLTDLVKSGPSTPRPEAKGVAPASTSSEPYPYSNVVSLAAAAKTQTAVDITSVLIRQGTAHTIDDKPHGALTNCLLLGLSGRADTNRDGKITYDELFRFARREMEKYSRQQPQLLAPSSFPLDQPVLGARAPESHGLSASAREIGTQGKIRVKLDKPGSDLEAKLRAMPDVQMAPGTFDVLVQTDASQWRLYDQGGALMEAIPVGQTEKLTTRIRAYNMLSRLRNWSNASQKFNVKLDVEPEHARGYDALRTSFRINEKATFRIATESPAYLLLLDINKDGRLSVLFPGPDEKEHGVQVSNSPIEFAVPITAPAGSDQLKLIAFPHRPNGWDAWTCTGGGCPEFDA
ncbi:MAG: caspase family protein, partial [Bryobacteraceae bacterium]